MPTFATLLLAGSLFGPGGPPRLISSLPVAHQILDEAPTRIRLGFSAAIPSDSAVITILSRDSVELLRLPAVRVPRDSTALEAAVPRKLLGGHYVVRWWVRDTRGAVTQGVFPFVIDIPE